MELETIIKLEEKVLKIIGQYKNVKREKSKLEEKVSRLEKDLERLKGEKERVRVKVESLLDRLNHTGLFQEKE